MPYASSARIGIEMPMPTADLAPVHAAPLLVLAWRGAARALAAARPDAEERAERDDRAADPDPDDERLVMTVTVALDPSCSKASRFMYRSLCARLRTAGVVIGSEPRAR
jgi:hypothetical protein